MNLQVQLINTGSASQPIQASSASIISSINNRSNTDISFNAVAEASVGGQASATPHMHTASNTEQIDQDNNPLETLNLGSTGLSRSASVRSTRSAISMSSSHASGSSMRKVLPCYNLEFHSLQPSLITDAGTDAKIAKIHKRGVEILDFAMLNVCSSIVNIGVKSV